jgi:hypothetical protein
MLDGNRRTRQNAQPWGTGRRWGYPILIGAVIGLFATWAAFAVASR